MSSAKTKGMAAKLRMVDFDRPVSLPIKSKEALKEAIVDYIIRDSSGGSYFRKMKQRKYEQVKLQAEVNGILRTLDCELPLILQKYTALSKNEAQNHTGIEELALDILDLLDKLEDPTILYSVEVQGEASAEKVVTVIVEKHFREKRREVLEGEYDEAKKTLFTKYKKVNFNEFGEDRNDRDLPTEKGSEDNSQRVSRSTVTALMEKEEYGKKHLQVPTKSKLKSLVDSCNVFDFPDRVEALRREKLISEFCGGKEANFIQTRQ
jgi:hypothetical protein